MSNEGVSEWFGRKRLLERLTMQHQHLHLTLTTSVWDTNSHKIFHSVLHWHRFFVQDQSLFCICFLLSQIVVLFTCLRKTWQYCPEKVSACAEWHCWSEPAWFKFPPFTLLSSFPYESYTELCSMYKDNEKSIAYILHQLVSTAKNNTEAL